MAEADILMIAHFNANDIIFHEGDEGDAAYMVKTGEVEIRLGMHSPNPRTLTMIQKGETFGELALCLDSPRTASAIATQDSELIMVSREDLLMVLGETSPVIKSLMLNLGKRIIELTDELKMNETNVNWHQWRKGEE